MLFNSIMYALSGLFHILLCTNLMAFFGQDSLYWNVT